jgi:hypothetical protein
VGVVLRVVLPVEIRELVLVVRREFGLEPLTNAAVRAGQ